MTAFSDETGREQAFERFPKIAGWIERLAGTQMDLSLKEWGEFLAELNVALSAAPVEMWKCAARKQSLPEPADCGWPTCGCDPHADKVIAALEEQGQASPVAQEPVAIKPLEWTYEPPYWVARVFGGFYSIERHEHGTELQGTFIRHLRCASVEAAKSAAQFDYEKRIRGALTIPPATPAGLGADEIARVFARWKNSKNLHESLAAQNIEKELLALLSRAGDQSNSTQKDGSR